MGAKEWARIRFHLSADYESQDHSLQARNENAQQEPEVVRFTPSMRPPRNARRSIVSRLGLLICRGSYGRARARSRALPGERYQVKQEDAG